MQQTGVVKVLVEPLGQRSFDSIQQLLPGAALLNIAQQRQLKAQAVLAKELTPVIAPAIALGVQPNEIVLEPAELCLRDLVQLGQGLAEGGPLVCGTSPVINALQFQAVVVDGMDLWNLDGDLMLGQHLSDCFKASGFLAQGFGVAAVIAFVESHAI